MAEQCLGTFAYNKFLTACASNQVNENKLLEIAKQISYVNIYGKLKRNIESDKYQGRSTAKDFLDDWYQLQEGERTEAALIMSVERLQEILRSDDVVLNGLANTLVDTRPPPAFDQEFSTLLQTSNISPSQLPSGSSRVSPPTFSYLMPNASSIHTQSTDQHHPRESDAFLTSRISTSKINIKCFSIVIVCLVLLILVFAIGGLVYFLCTTVIHKHKMVAPIQNYTETSNNCTALVLIGGENEDTAPESIKIVASSHCHPPNDIPQLNKVISNPVAGVLNNDLLIVCGGCKDPPNCGLGETSCYLLDLRKTEAVWKECPPLAEPRMHSASFFMKDGTMCVAGGVSPNSRTDNGRSSVECFSNNTWKNGSPLPTPTAYHCIATIGNKVCSTDGKPNGHLACYDGEKNVWEKHGEFQYSRYDHSCIGFEVDGTEFILVEGGLTENGKCAPTEIYNLRTNTTEVHHHIHCREGARLVRMNGKILLIGGVVRGGDKAHYPTGIYTFNLLRWNKNPTLDLWDLDQDITLDTGRSGHDALLIPLL